MKLDWRINNCRVLVAAARAVTYYVTPGVTSLWKPSKRFVAFDGKVEAEGAVDGMSLANAIAWCERDAERPEGCPAQPPAADPVAPKASGPVSKFPSTMDAEEWGVGAAKGTGGDWTCAKILKDWFQAALSFAYVRGSEETLEKQKLAERANPVAPLNSFDARVWAKEFMRIHRSFIMGMVQADEETMVGWFSNALMRGYDERRSRENGWQRFTRDTYAEFLAKNPYPPPPSAQAPEPPSVEDRVAALKNKTAAELRDEVDRRKRELDALRHESVLSMIQAAREAHTEGSIPPGFGYEEAPAVQGDLGAEVAFLKKRLGALEERVEFSAKSSCVAGRLKEMESRMTQFVAAKCQALDHRINSAMAPINRELGELRAIVQARSDVLHDHKATLSYHDKRLEKLEART